MRGLPAVQMCIRDRYGHVDRVDHRTLKSQREEALRNGDVVLAEILNRFPEAHMRPKALLEEVNPEVEALKAYRLKKDRYQKLLLRADELQRKIREKDVYKRQAVSLLQCFRRCVTY